MRDTGPSRPDSRKNRALYSGCTHRRSAAERAAHVRLPQGRERTQLVRLGPSIAAGSALAPDIAPLVEMLIKLQPDHMPTAARVVEHRTQRQQLSRMTQRPHPRLPTAIESFCRRSYATRE